MSNVPGVRSIRGDENERTSPESLMISALIRTGRFNPEEYGVSVDDCLVHVPLWTWLDAYQRKYDELPTIEIINKRHPEFQYLPNVNISFAAQELARHGELHKMRASLRSALNYLGQEDPDAARQELGKVYGMRPKGRGGSAIWELPEERHVQRHPVPFPSLMRSIGGIGRGELWYMAARPGAGKTMMCCYYAAAFIEAGMNIAYLSLEVPRNTINKRTRRALATPEELALLDSSKRADVLAGIESQRGRVKGSMRCYDTSDGRMSSATVRQHMSGADLLIVDHVGLLYTADGRRAVEDWRAMAVISNTLMEDKLATGVPVLAAAQLNRLADNASDRAPKASTLSQSDALNQDGDVVITMKRISERVLIHSTEKVREAAKATWYSIYDVKHADYKEISRDKAEDLKLEDGDWEMA